LQISSPDFLLSFRHQESPPSSLGLLSDMSFTNTPGNSSFGHQPQQKAAKAVLCKKAFTF